MATRSNKKIALSVLALGGATAMVVFGSWAAWTAQTTNPGNTVTAGRLTMGNEKGGVDNDGNPVLSQNITDVLPGTTGTDTVTLENTSSGPMAVTLTKTASTDQLSDGDNVLKLTIFDDEIDECVYPAVAGPCPDLDHATAGAAWITAIDALALDGSGGANWAAGESHDFVLTWEYTDNGDVNNINNVAAARTATFDLTWNGTPA